MNFFASAALLACNAYGQCRALINAVAGARLAIALFSLFAAALPAEAAPGPIRLIVLGDSLAAGYGLTRADAFPSQLERALIAQGLSVRVSDASVSGDTSAGGRARLAWALGSTPQDQPDAAIVELGANDALRGFQPEVTYRNLDAILTELAQRDIPVLLAGMQAPPNLGTDYQRAFDAIYPRLAKAHRVALYPFFLDGVAAVSSLNLDDGIHPNAAGVAEIVRRITPPAAALVRATLAARMDKQ